MIDRRQGIFDEYRWIISRLQWLLDGIVVVLMLFLICWICGESFRLIFQVLGLVAIATVFWLLWCFVVDGPIPVILVRPYVSAVAVDNR